MSKSLGNQFTLGDLVARGASLRALRYLMLSVHYRQKLNFTFAALEAAGAALRRVDDFRFRLAHAVESGEPNGGLAAATESFVEAFDGALGDDLNAAGALGALFDWIREANTAVDRGLGIGDRERATAALARAEAVFGVFDGAAWKSGDASEEDAAITALVEEREAARKRRDWASADRLRRELEERSIVVEDTPHGPRWKRR